MYSLFTKKPKSTVTATKKCRDIIFFMKGLGIVNFYVDGKLLHEIWVEYTGWGGGEQDWKPYYFYFPEGLHTFTWEYVDKLQTTSHLGIGLDAITFGVYEKK
jgi:hypothetical protein